MFQNPFNPITLDAREGFSAALSIRPGTCPSAHREQQQIVSS